MNGNAVSYERVSYMPVMVDMSRPGATPYARGGLAKAAKKVAGAGEGGDSMIVHVNKAEFEEMVRHFGPPERNPETGMYAFKPFYKQKWFKQWAAPVATVALSGLIPGLGLGPALGTSLGLTGTAASTVGTGLVGAGLGGLTGGGEGALTGALTGGLAGYTVPGLVGEGGIFSQGIAPAINNLFNGAPAAAGAAGAAAPAAGGAAAGGAAAGGAAAGGAGGAAAGGSSMLNRVGQLAALGMVGNAVLGATNARGSSGSAPPPQQNDPNMTARLPEVEFRRTRRQMPTDLSRYAMASGEQDFYEENELPETPRTPAAMGGLMRAAQGRYVKGQGHGREDRIPALLSDGEYVFDAETVSMLGDGSSDAGAKKLDQMREQIRKHKAGGLARGRMSPDAKDPARYLHGAR